MSRLLALASLGLLAACGGVQHAWSGATLCEIERPSPAEPAPDAWLALLLRGYDASTRRTTTPAVDCVGAQVRWDAPAHQCQDASTTRALLPQRPIAPEDVLVVPLGEKLRLVWVITSRYASGDALGPAAVVELRASRLQVKAVGPLRANPLRARLRLERLGDDELVVAEGERCASADPASCDRSARVLIIAGDRLEPVAVTGEAGGCAGAAWFPLGREEQEKLQSGWTRRFRLDGSLRFAPDGLHVAQQVVVHDLDPRQPSAPPRLFRRADAEEVLPFKGRGFVSSGASLWDRMRQGSN